MGRGSPSCSRPSSPGSIYPRLREGCPEQNKERRGHVGVSPLRRRILLARPSSIPGDERLPVRRTFHAQLRDKEENEVERRPVGGLSLRQTIQDCKGRRQDEEEKR